MYGGERVSEELDAKVAAAILSADLTGYFFRDRYLDHLAINTLCSN
jgi:hypothetical protein